MEISANITGVKEVEKVFRKLPASSQNKAFRPALRKGGYVVRDQARKNVKAVVSNEATGLLERNLRVYSLRKLRGNLRVGVQVKRGLVSRKGVRVGLYAAVLEYGRNDGTQPPRSWIRKAIRETPSKVLQVTKDEVYKRMPDVVRDAKR